MIMCAFLTNSFLYFLFSMKASNEKFINKSNTEGLLLVKENIDKEILYEDIYSEEFYWVNDIIRF